MVFFMLLNRPLGALLIGAAQPVVHDAVPFTALLSLVDCPPLPALYFLSPTSCPYFLSSTSCPLR